MKNKKTLFYRLLTVLVLLAIAALMFVIGRGHTIYFDNKTLEMNGVGFPSLYKVVVNSGGDEIAALMKRERGMMTTLGQRLRFSLAASETKDSEAVVRNFDLSLPYHLDGIVLNLPALLAGEGPEVYLSEFVSMATESEPVEEVLTEEDLLPSDF